MEAFLSVLSDAPNHYRLRLRHITDSGEQLHYHDCYQVLYVLEGKMVHGKADQQVILEPGDAFVVPPGYIHKTGALEGRDLTYYSLSFQTSLFSPGFVVSPVHDFLDDLRLNALLEQDRDVRLRVRLPQQEQQQMTRMMTGLMEEYTGPWTQEQTLASHLVAAILRILSRSYGAEQRKPREDSLQACIRYLDQNYRMELSLDDLAKRFAMSRSVLVQQFAARTGMPVKRYLHHKRIRQAQKLCAVDGISIREIAGLVGYQDFSTFYRNFKKLTGYAPADYRAYLQQAAGETDGGSRSSVVAMEESG